MRAATFISPSCPSLRLSWACLLDLSSLAIAASTIDRTAPAGPPCHERGPLRHFDSRDCRTGFVEFHFNPVPASPALVPLAPAGLVLRRRGRRARRDPQVERLHGHPMNARGPSRPYSVTPIANRW